MYYVYILRYGAWEMREDRVTHRSTKLRKYSGAQKKALWGVSQ